MQTCECWCDVLISSSCYEIEDVYLNGVEIVIGPCRTNRPWNDKRQNRCSVRVRDVTHLSVQSPLYSIIMHTKYLSTYRL